ncbi:MAG TPA: hypothetical protein VNU68_33740 [Verrucomicrobiae bacterium]|nr:hypothetical protein [Verrucomicrobiae bacterium]
MSLQNSLNQPDPKLASTAVPANDPSAVHENVVLPVPRIVDATALVLAH